MMNLVSSLTLHVSRVAAAIFILFALLPMAHALAMAPPQATAAFEPNAQARSFDFELINNEERPVNVELHAQGGLASLVTLPEKKFTMRPHESKKVEFSVALPATLALPASVSVIASTPAQNGKGGNIGAMIGLEFVATIKDGKRTEPKNVPISGAGAAKMFSGSAAEVEIEDVRFENIGKETAKLIIDLKNTGQSDADVTTEVRFGGGENARVAKAEPAKITGGATRRLVTYVDVKGLPSGNYDAEVVLKYADRIKKQLIKLQIIETGTNQNPVYAYVIVGSLIAFNLVFLALIISKRRRENE